MKKKIAVIVGIVVLGFGAAGVGIGIAHRGHTEYTEPTEAMADSDTEEIQEVDNDTVAAIEEPAATEKPDVISQTDGIGKEDTAALQTPGTSVSAEAPAQQPAAPQTPVTPATAEAPTQQPAVPQTPATAEAPAQQPATPQTPSAAATTEAPHTPVWHEPVYEQVWVVDLEAGWYEYPIYENGYRMVCTGCGGYMYTDADVAVHTCNASWYDELYPVLVGTGTEYIYEQGHYETVLVREGYWE